MNRFVTRAGLGLVTATLAFASVAFAQGGTSAPAKDAPKAAEPKKEAPKADAPKAAEPKAAEPKKEAPKADAPKAAEPAKPAAPAAAAPSAGGNTVVDMLAHDSNFSTLAGAIKAAGLDKMLMEKGPFTVFAPTNEAFAKVPAADLANLMKPENKAQLTALLQNHVFAGSVMAADVAKMNGKTAKVASGKELMVEGAEGKGWKIGGANITKTDMKAGNGVVHTIDTVLMPK